MQTTVYIVSAQGLGDDEAGWDVISAHATQAGADAAIVSIQQGCNYTCNCKTDVLTVA